MWQGTVKLYDAETGQLLNTLAATRRTKWGERRERVTSIAFSPNSTKIASAAGHDVKLWDVETGENIATFQVAERFEVESIAFSPDGTKLAVGADAGVKLLNILTGKHLDLLGMQCGSNPLRSHPMVRHSLQRQGLASDCGRSRQGKV